MIKKTRMPCPVIITSYSKFVGKARHKDYYKDLSYEAIILDEGHDIKNSNTQRFTFLSTLTRKKGLIITGMDRKNEREGGGRE